MLCLLVFICALTTRGSRIIGKYNNEFSIACDEFHYKQIEIYEILLPLYIFK